MDEIGYNRDDIKMLYKMKKKRRDNPRYNSGTNWKHQYKGNS